MTAHEKRIQKIEAECVEIRKQSMQLEFQNKKDIREFEKQQEQRRKEHEQWRKEIDKDFKFLSSHAKHLSKLAGITFEELGELDERLESASVSLSRKSKKSK